MGLFNSKQQADDMPENPIICPFCGNRSRNEKFCSSCGAKFNKEVLKIASREKNDDRSDRIGPFSTKTAKYLLYGLMGVLIIVFILITESLRNNPLFN